MAADADIQARIAGLDALALADTNKPNRRRDLWRAVWPKVVAVFVVLAIWQIAVWSHHWRPYVLYGPGPTLSYLRHLVTTGAFWSSLGVTARRALEGFVLATVIGSAVGIATARSWVVRSAISSLLTGLQSMPTIVWPLFGAMLLGLSNGAILLVVVLGTSPFVARSLLSGLDQVQPILIRAGKTLGARRLALVRHVILPAAFPSVVTDIRRPKRERPVHLCIGLTAALLGAFLMIGRDIGDHAFVECDLLHLTWHAAQIDQESVHLGHPHQRVLIQQAGQRPLRIQTAVSRTREITRALALAVL